MCVRMPHFLHTNLHTERETALVDCKMNWVSSTGRSTKRSLMFSKSWRLCEVVCFAAGAKHDLERR